MTKEELMESLALVRKGSRKLVGLDDEVVTQILREVADLAWARREEVLTANREDLNRMDPADPKYDRLLLDEERLKGILSDMRRVAALPSPLGMELEKRTLPNGLEISRVSVPIGVMAVIYESRPNVTFDVFALCLKTGNACVLKGSKDARDSNAVMVGIIEEILRRYDLQEVVYLAPADREVLVPILNATGYIDCVVPRGSRGLIDFVRQNATVPVIETGAGIVHTYVDRSADLQKARAIIRNAKTRRVSVCNSLDCLILHKDLLPELAGLVAPLEDANVQLYAEASAYGQLEGKYQKQRLHLAKEEDFGVEWLDYKLSVKVVEDLEHALEHIARYSSGHSEAVVAEDQEVIDRFLQQVDAACVYANASTAFSDGGEFGLGAEIGISTQKLHARGPMGLREMTSYKWVVRGAGQVR